MSDAYIGEIRMFGGNFAPQGWALCDGQLLPIPGNDALFALIGTIYGGDGQTTFAVPDLRGRLPVHQGNGHAIGSRGGAEEVTLTTDEIPGHGHPLFASEAAADQATPAGNVFGRNGSFDLFRLGAPTADMAPSSISPTGGSQPHGNMQPYLCINFIIALVGIFPSQT